MIRAQKSRIKSGFFCIQTSEPIACLRLAASSSLSNSPSHLPITAEAMELPTALVAERPMSRKRSIPRISTMPSTGKPNCAKVPAITTKEAAQYVHSADAAAPLQVRGHLRQTVTHAIEHHDLGALRGRCRQRRPIVQVVEEEDHLHGAVSVCGVGKIDRVGHADCILVLAARRPHACGI